MSLIQEIHSQPPIVRYALFVFTVVIAVSVVGFFWFNSVEEQIFMAMHDDPKEREEFLAQREERMPQPLAAMGRAWGSLTARMGSLLGFDRSSGFDRTDRSGQNQDSVHLLPLSN